VLIDDEAIRGIWPCLPRDIFVRECDGLGQETIDRGIETDQRQEIALKRGFELLPGDATGHTNRVTFDLARRVPWRRPVVQ